MLAAAEVARHAHGTTLFVHDDHGVSAVGLAGAAIVLDRSARSICPVKWHVASRSYAATTTELIAGQLPHGTSRVTFRVASRWKKGENEKWKE
jgi:hypothetical protein